jgi:hypothetical protein
MLCKVIILFVSEFLFEGSYAWLPLRLKQKSYKLPDAAYQLQYYQLSI